MNRYFTLLTILYLVTYPISAQNNSNEIYDKGFNALKNNDFKGAEEFFKESIIKNGDSGSLYQMGLLLLKKDTYESRNLALENFKKAALLSPDNFEYRIAYASLLEKMAPATAYNEFELLTSAFPGRAIPWLKMGKIKLSQYLEFLYSKSLGRYYADSPVDTPPDNDLVEIIKKDSVELIRIFGKVLEIDPVNSEAFYNLGRLFEHSQDYNKAIYFTSKAAEYGGKNKDINLLLGILYIRTGKLKNSDAEFRKAFEKMMPEEKEDYEYNSIVKVLTPKYITDEKYVTRKEKEDFIARYWKMSDPQESAPYNQTMLEHFSRVAYANLHFSIPRYNIEGWKTERGEVFIRYGAPAKITKFRPEYSFTEGTNGVFFPKNETWVYNGFTFTFDDINITGNSRLTFDMGDFFGWRSNPRTRANPRSNVYSFEMFEKIKSAYNTIYRPKGNRFSVPTKLYTFKSSEGRNRTDCYLVYPIPNKITGGKLNLKDASWDFGVYCYDSALNEILGKRGSVDKENVVQLARETLNKEMVSYVKLSPPQETSSYKFQINRNSDSSFYSYTVPYSFKQFTGNNLDISDIIAAGIVSSDKEIAGSIKRGEYYILPEITNNFSRKEPVNLYYEIYSLTSGGNNLTSFEQKITVEKPDGSKNNSGAVLETLWNGIKKIFKGEGEKTSLTSIYQTMETNTRQHLALDFSRYTAGQYLIALLVKDLVSGKEVEKKIQIEITE